MGKKQVLKEKNGPHLSCNLHKIGANIYSKLPVAPFCAKKYGLGWVGGWMDGWVDGWMVEPGQGLLTAIKK